MTTNYTWFIYDMLRNSDSEVIHTVEWGLKAEDGTYGLDSSGSILLDEPAEGDPVIPYADLTETIVNSWVADKLGETEITSQKAELQARLDELHQPSSLSGKPW